MRAESNLRALQEQFLSLVAARHDVATTLRERGLDSTYTEALVREDDRLDATGRIDIYADMYFVRLRDALREDFPAVEGVLGKDAFHDLAMDYFQVHPPSSPSLRNAGARLPSYLPNHRSSATHPWLGDLARLEWARVEVFDRADAEPLTLQEVQRLPAEQIAALPLRVVPAFQLLKLSARVQETWRRIQDGLAGGQPPASEIRVIVWRRDSEVYHRGAHDEEGPALELLANETTFASVCGHFSEGRSAMEAARIAWRIVGGWLSAGFIRNPTRG